MNTLISHIDQDGMSRSEKLRLVLILLFVFSLPFDRFYTTMLIMLLIVCTFIDISLRKLKSIPKQIWIFQSVFILAVLGYGYSLNKHEAGFMLEKQLAILAFPLILPLAVALTLDRVKLLLIALSAGSFTAIVYLFAHVFYVVIFGGLPLSLIFSKEFFNHGFSAPLSIHAGYLSLYVSFSIVFLAGEFVAQKQKSMKMVLFLVLCILVAGLFFLASRNSIITTFLIISLLFPFFHVKKKGLFFGVIAVLAGVSFLLFNHVNYLHERFSSDLITDIHSNVSDYNFDGAEPRIERWKAALELVPQSPLIGYGTGDESDMLKTKYVEKELFISYLEGFNSHNQYLSYLIKNGLIGLLLFLASFYYYLRIAIKTRHFLYLSFLAIMLIGFLTENILDANKGIYFFALFNTFIGYALINHLKAGSSNSAVSN